MATSSQTLAGGDPPPAGMGELVDGCGEGAELAGVAVAEVGGAVVGGAVVGGAVVGGGVGSAVAVAARDAALEAAAPMLPLCPHPAARPPTHVTAAARAAAPACRLIASLMAVSRGSRLPVR